MNPFLTGGLIAGGLLLVLYVLLAVKAKTPPTLGHALEILISAVGASAGVKICGYVISGQVTAAFKYAAEAHKVNIAVSDDDSLYFFFGGCALAWIAAETIIRRLWTIYQDAYPRGSSAVPQRGPGTP